MGDPMTNRLAVVAVGGNSLIRDTKHQTVQDQYLAVQETARHVAEMIVQGWRVVITHGNGPQVGFVLRRSELARQEVHELPLDTCGANTQGAIGYQFQKALRNELVRRGLPSETVTLVTQVRVSLDDPAFRNPSKPIGSFMDQATALKRRDEDGWAVIEDAGRGWRRVVPSPEPQAIIELQAIKALAEAGFVVVCAGGGGVPVYQDAQGDLVGLEGVIDKDRASSLLATGLRADLLLISTAVERVAINFNRPDQRWLERMTLGEARSYLAAGQFPKGSMGPKIESIIGFLERGGSQALITDPPNIGRALRGETGTWIAPG
jgi:carbamate kinase